ncbi:hypothetical protein, partial [Amaricoccus tamworthensis]|uniref:hypothetical protein n=1 Tax=Amaricoccus tamworthensis TaxID=57002 RepID=UPI003C7DAD1E
MNNHFSSAVIRVSLGTTQEQLKELIKLSKDGLEVEGLLLINPFTVGASLPPGSDISRVLLLGADLLLVQQNGEVLVLVGGGEGSYELLLDGLTISSSVLQNAAVEDSSWTNAGDGRGQDTFDRSRDGDISEQGSGSSLPVSAGDPLEGLEIHPLLPPTDYPDRQRPDRHRGGEAYESTAVPVIVIDPDAVYAETDAPLSFALSDRIGVELAGDSIGEYISEVTVSLLGLPSGTTASAGNLIDAGNGTFTLEFTGSLANYNALTLTFPEDFSSDSRIDFPAGDLTGEIKAKTNFGDEAVSPISLRITPEGDVSIDDSLPDRVADETDAVVALVPASLLLPEATDLDGSEALGSLTLVIEGLPGDGSFTLADIAGLPAGAVADLATAADGASTLTLTMSATDVGDLASAYAGIMLNLPADFSTTNRSDLDDDGNGPDAGDATALPITLTLTVRTDEDQANGDDTAIDGEATATRTIDIEH